MKTTTTDNWLARHSRFLWLGALFSLQAFCAVFFVGDAMLDLFADAESSLPFDQIEYLVAFALFIGVFVTGYELRRLVQRNSRLTEQIRAASGEFGRLLEEQFDAWSLTAAERDVATLALKGLSVAEIAAARGSREGTVKAHSAAVYRKAGVSGRLELLSFFLDEIIAEPVAPNSVVNRP